MDLLLVACQVLIGSVFAVAAFTKLRSRADLRSFASTLVMVPERLRLPVAAVVAAGEAATVALMVIPEIGLVLGGIMLGAFSVVIAVSARRGARVSCRCFGPSVVSLGWVHLVRNALLLVVVALGGMALTLTSGPPAAAALAVAIPAGLVGAVVLVAFDDIAGLFMNRTGSV
ncbi:MauE/DoxX family redox-associated membrane protein [Nonomuraea sp. SBT364]|uniref:MauE/DoxX family redox-associated membrane protein n=1 Tax=Nonomuraea sp. SBT364 TaxID=1580530 RepID=UPI00066D5218|nr:MauE/DoxX family redox-associated membrane protein [Nonomuraea sp. SBT364]